MGAVVFLTGEDTITITQGSKTYTLANFADGNVAELTIPNDLADDIIGKDGNAVIAYNAAGLASELDVRVIMASADDQALGAILAAYNNNRTGFITLGGTFVKSGGDGNGNQQRKTYVTSGGYIKKIPTAVYNVSGDGQQGVVSYKIRFTNTSIPNFS